MAPHKRLSPKDTVCFNIKTSWHAISRMYNAAGIDYDMSASLGYVLINIDEENGTPATKIASNIGMESRSLSRMLKTVEDKGLIYRKVSETDKRVVRIFLTEEGKQKREMSKAAVKAFNKLLREKIPTDKLGVFFEVIDEINNIANNKDLLAREKISVELNLKNKANNEAIAA
jgi:DNA-binding MarR family transcriptional regulator